MRVRSRRGPSWAQHLRFLAAFRRERGYLLVLLAPVLLAIDRILLPPRAPSWMVPAQLGAAVMVAAGGLLLRLRPAWARAIAMAGIVLGAAPIVPLTLEHPELVVVGAIGLWLLLHLLFSEPEIVLASSMPKPAPWRTARTASLLALGVWFTQVLARARLDVVDALITAAPLLVAGVVAFRWARRERDRAWVRWALGATMAAALGGALFARDSPELSLTWLALVPFVTLLLVRGDTEEGSLGRLVEHPARLLTATFFALAVLGTALLALPAASATSSSIGVLDAAFTSVSAVCVTGLIVLDTPNAFSQFGQLVLLALIQVGGLGIMTFYTVALAALGRRLSLRHERAIAGAMNVEDRQRLVDSLRRVLVLTFASELAGGALLFGGFLLEGEALGSAAWRAVFTSVSAFCNAGFALQTDSLLDYQTSPLVLHTVGALIIVGGLSPAGVAAIPAWIRGRRVRLQERLLLVTSAALLIGGAVLYTLFEWSDSLGHLDWINRIHNAIFQSITLRTAGFNSVDLAITEPATQTLMIVFMLIGGSPGGTAGGLKTTTIAVIALMVVATLMGRRRAGAAGRSLGTPSVFKAGAVVTVGVVTFLSALLAIQLTQAIELEVAAFEVASALGTVGLSIGGTGLLDSVGKIIIMLCMFAGRVGPLTLFLFLTEQQRETPVTYPEEEVDVG